MGGYIMAIDQGTTSSRSLVFAPDGRVVSMAQYPVTQYYPSPGWVEHDPQELFSTSARALGEAFAASGLKPADIEAIGITNQRETAILWDRASGKSVYNAIVWQCRRTGAICEALEKEGLGAGVKEKTGLLIDAYFSGTKFKWLLDNVGGLRERASAGLLMGGTVDSWLIWNLTGRHVTDHSNASRTMLFDINKLRWDDELCAALNVPVSILPEPVQNSEVYGRVKPGIPGLEPLAGIPVCGSAGDQQAALFGQCCFKPGMTKNTYGTGCFAVMNTGGSILRSKKLVSTVGWTLRGNTTYCLEGSVFNAGSAIQWLRDELGFFESSPQINGLAGSVSDTGGVYMVPAFTGLGAPYWDMDARGLICGITRGTGRAHIARAALESIAFQTAMLIDAMEDEMTGRITELRADGGASASDFLMQFQADILDIPVVRPSMVETTAAGAAYLAGLAAGVWSDESELVRQRGPGRVFLPAMDERRRAGALDAWKEAVRRALTK